MMSRYRPAGRRLAATVALAALGAVTLAACGGGTTGVTAEGGEGKGTITVWAHQGQEAEVAALQAAVKGFNDSQKDITVKLKLVPEADYTKTIAAAQPDDLPDVLEFDGPTLASLVYDQKVSPIEEFISSDTKSNATPAMLAQGTVDGKLYGLGQFDSGLGMWGNKKLLDAAGVSYPTGLDDAWTAEEFTAALGKLAGKDADGKVLDVKENYGFGSGIEWTTYGFSPVVWSAGGTLIADGKADGALNSPKVVDALTAVQGWKKQIDPNAKDDAFTSGKVALSWVGHWVYPGYAEALGDDLVLLPLPDFGSGVKTGQGSWGWGISAASKNGKAAGTFLDHLLGDDSVAAMTKANGAPPGTKSALANSELYQPDGPLALYSQQLERSCGADDITADCMAVTRPVTPGYPVITREFAKAFKNIYEGGDVKKALDQAAKAIDTDFADNDGYEIS